MYAIKCQRMKTTYSPKQNVMHEHCINFNDLFILYKRWITCTCISHITLFTGFLSFIIWISCLQLFWKRVDMKSIWKSIMSLIYNTVLTYKNSWHGTVPFKLSQCLFCCYLVLISILLTTPLSPDCMLMLTYLMKLYSGV